MAECIFKLLTKLFVSISILPLICLLFFCSLFVLDLRGQTIIVTVTGSTNTSFGTQCINSFSNSTTYLVSGTGLIGNITITAPAGFQVRTGSNAFSSSFDLVPSGSTVPNTTIEARFSPVSTGATGTVNITHSSPGATTVNLGVNGTGIDGGTCNSFFISSGTIVRVNTAAGLTPTLHVNGDISSKNAVFTNNGGIIQLTGNWYNSSSSNAYVSTGTERFTGSNDQVIAGDWTGTSGNQNQFYNLKINKTGTTGETVSLLDNVNINSAGSVELESSNGIIRTQGTSSISPYTGNYTNTLYVQNPSPSAISGHSVSNGAQTRYIEGKLRRQVNAASTYYFPIGVEKGGLDGMEAFAVTFNTAPASTGLLGYIQPAANPSVNVDLIANGDVLFYDVGAFDGSNEFFSQCIGPQDGHDDVAAITQAITHEWITEAAGTYNYNMTVYPGTNLDNLTYAIMGAPCNTPFPKAQYLARNGRIGGDGAVGPTVNYWVPGVTGLYQAPTLTTLNNQTAFSSRYRLFSAIDNNTSLPVELFYLKATPVNNEYIRVDWSTASEVNNMGFYLERSTDGTAFTTIAWIDGKINSSSRQDYLYNDRDVSRGIVYYYRLRQVDLDGHFSYTYIVSARLTPYGTESVFAYPNPTSGNIYVQVMSPVDREYTLQVFDALGQVMFQSKLLAEANQPNYVLVPSETWAKGMYMIRTRSDEHENNAIKFLKK